MRAELAAVTALLSPLHPTHDTVAPKPPLTFPYYLLWASTGLPAAERSVEAETSHIDDVIGLTTVGLTAESVRIAAGAAREALCPGGKPASLTVAGRVVTIAFSEARPIRADEDVTLTAGAHPVFGVDLYRLVSSPA